MRKYILFLVISIAIFNIAVLPVFAQQATPGLETTYPSVPGPAVPPGTPGTTTDLPRYVEYLFYFLVWGSGILALLALIFGGFAYITAVGNPDKLRDARDKIISALLGLAIVVGSYTILWQINPQFLSFNLPPLRPMINTVSPGVWICRDINGTDILTVWTLQQIYSLDRIDPTLVQPALLNSIINMLLKDGIVLSNITDSNNITIRRQIRDKIDELLENIDNDCYQVTAEGKIRDDFNNKSFKIWFVPEVKITTDSSGQKTITRIAKYGAAVFDDDDFTGLGNIYIWHFYIIGYYLDWFQIEPGVAQKDNIEVSSIKPFKYDYNTNYNWTVALYLEKNYNAGFTTPGSSQTPGPYWTLDPISHGNPWLPYGDQDPGHISKTIPKMINISAPLTYPRSLKLTGDVMLALYKDYAIVDSAGNIQTAPEIQIGNQSGRYFQIFFEDDNNLEDNYNIVAWSRCPGYIAPASVLNQCPLTVATGTAYITGVGYTTPQDCCAVADSDGILIVPGIIPL